MDGSNDDTVCLLVEGEKFAVSKNLLSFHSNYFRAMFSGNYKEADEGVIKLQVITAASMTEVVKFMQTGAISITKVADQIRLLNTALFLNMDSLCQALLSRLEEYITLQSWISILETAGPHSHRLARRAANFGLYNISGMHNNVTLFPDLSRLYWYISHPYLVADSELQIFQLGAKWISEQENVHPDAIFVVIGSLALDKLSKKDFEIIAQNAVVEMHARAFMLVKCLIKISEIFLKVNLATVNNFLESDTEFSKTISDEVKELAQCIVRRACVRVPCVTGSVVVAEAGFRDADPQYIYCWRPGQTRMTQWLHVANKLWGWSWAAWGLHHVAVVGGEVGRGTGVFERQVRVYDVLTDHWDRHEELLGHRRHAGIALHNDTLYIVGGVGQFRMVLSSCVAYDLAKQKSSPLPSLPERIQNPACAVHNDILYVAGQTHLYVLHENERWDAILVLPQRFSCMLSWLGELHVVENGNTELFGINSDRPAHIFQHIVAGVCDTGEELVAFTNSLIGDISYVETSITLESVAMHFFRFHAVSGCAALYVDVPPLQSSPVPSSYINKYLREMD